MPNEGRCGANIWQDTANEEVHVEPQSVVETTHSAFEISAFGISKIMAKTEDIEARLAAYVDGDIDDAARAEIEKHLAGNAQHRQLIAELMQQRDILRGLPREAAPQEVAEAVNSQLERAVLLGDIDAEADAASMRIGRWPQIRAIAAVLLFTASLAAVIYYLLPSANERPTLVDDLRTMRPATPLPADAASPATASPAPALAMAPTTLQTPSEQQQRATLALNDTRGAAGAGQLELRDSPPAASTPLVLPSAEQVFRDMVTAPAARPSNLPVPPATIVVCAIPTANPDAAAREISQYLSGTPYAWEASGQQPAQFAINSASTPLPLNQMTLDRNSNSNPPPADGVLNGSNTQSNFMSNGGIGISNNAQVGNNVYDPRV
ncbi:MAG TPA: zf-HC2 domain-containing protein, partial [Dongiaceae bacterium]|nr:zf-HC2 domain-containing protein [Dongiaceae bacterium]